MKQLFPHIAIDSKIQFGKPVIAGTRVPVEIIVGNVAAGMTIEAVAEEYNLTKTDVLAALKYAAKLVAAETILAR
ncbi:DUF433 domain-containing protein [Candidatus Wolfebacteria bacterium]|nr:DUF433 domain-containing protein [Candidatus Wolfebacteria bacterium]